MSLWGWHLLVNVQVPIFCPRAVGCRRRLGRRDWVRRASRRRFPSRRLPLGDGTAGFAGWNQSCSTGA